MSLKQFIVRKLSLFFMLTTLITVAVYLIGSALDRDARFGYEVLLTPMLYAACCVIPTCITYSRRELKPREMMVRMVLEWFLIEVVMLTIAFRSSEIDTDRISVVLLLAGSVLVIYVLARALSWLRDSLEAKKMNADLMKFQQIHEN